MTILRSKVHSQLRSEVLHHQPTTRRGVDNDHGSWNIHILQDLEVGHVEFEWLYPHLRHGHKGRLAVRKLGFQSQWLPATNQPEGHHTSGRNFTNHAPQLLDALHSRTIHTEDDVVLFDPGFTGGGVLVHHGHFHAVVILE